MCLSSKRYEKVKKKSFYVLSVQSGNKVLQSFFKQPIRHSNAFFREFIMSFDHAQTPLSSAFLSNFFDTCLCRQKVAPPTHMPSFK